MGIYQKVLFYYNLFWCSNQTLQTVILVHCLQKEWLLYIVISFNFSSMAFCISGYPIHR